VYARVLPAIRGRGGTSTQGGDRNVDVYEALYTTRAMRRVRPDPIPLDVQARMIDAAIRAPTGSNAQSWRFILVDDPDLRSRLGLLYRETIDRIFATNLADAVAAAEADPDRSDHADLLRMFRSARWLADHFAEVPLLLFPFTQFTASNSVVSACSSIFPPVWSAQLAARAEGVGSVMTGIFSEYHRDEVHDLLGVPGDSGWTLVCCITFGYPLGRWGVAPRRPAHEVAARNRWDAPPGFEAPAPLWAPSSGS
jgi:nitroreductase